MAVLELVDSGSAKQPEQARPARRREPAAQPETPAPAQGTDRVSRIRAEIDSYYEQLVGLNIADTGDGEDPIEIFQLLSSISARMSQIRTTLVRIEGRASQALRTREVDPLLEEVDRQFKIHSRIQACRQMEADLIRGQV